MYLVEEPGTAPRASDSQPSWTRPINVIGGLEESMIQEGVISLRPINVIEIDIKKLVTGVYSDVKVK